MIVRVVLSDVQNAYEVEPVEERFILDSDQRNSGAVPSLSRLPPTSSSLFTRTDHCYTVLAKLMS